MENEKNKSIVSADSGTLKPEDYTEPRCLLCGDPYGMTPEVRPVPVQRIIEKLDEYQSRKDPAGAERHLKYWLEEAKLGHDLRGQLSIRNEMIGFYRKNGRREEAFESIDEALRLLDELEFDSNISAGTTCTNAATAYYRFGEYEKSLFLFKKAKAVYEENPATDPFLLGGLYNNMALANTALKRYEESAKLYKEAISIMEKEPDGKPEQAISYLNLADVWEARYGTEGAETEIFECLDKAECLLNEAFERIKNGNGSQKGYYAFVCESCAPTFLHYGYFMTSQELNRRAKEIYEGNRAG